METWSLIAGLLAAGLLVYLVIVLLYPEDFS
jgi:K+-transporting ATPase KdpF subunit